VRRNLHAAARFGREAMPPELREGQMSSFAKRIMRKPRTLHCPFCDGKVLFTRNEEHLDAKNCPHCGMRVERREWPEKMYDPRPILRAEPGGPDSLKIEMPEGKEPPKKPEKKD
jgi:DNA-directed RNA polymerase subunit RPC12/RpoP